MNSYQNGSQRSMHAGSNLLAMSLLMNYISNMIKKFGVDAAILLGNIQSMENMLVGTLVLRINGSPKAIEDSIAYLRENDILVEVQK